MAILKIRDAEGNVQEVLALKGEDGKNYVLTEADKQEIADIIKASDTGGTGNKSLVFGSEDNLMGFVYGNENLYYYDTPIMLINGFPNDKVYKTFTIPAGTYYFNWTIDFHNKVNYYSAFLVVYDQTHDAPISEGVNTFTSETEVIVYVVVGGDLSENALTAVNIEFQIDRGETLGKPIEPYTREDGLTTENLNIGDLLLVDAENSNNYFWNGNDIVKLNSFPNGDEVSY